MTVNDGKYTPTYIQTSSTAQNESFTFTCNQSVRMSYVSITKNWLAGKCKALPYPAAKPVPLYHPTEAIPTKKNYKLQA